MKRATTKKRPAGKKTKKPATKKSTPAAAIRRRIQARNQRFKKMGAVQKRIAIAKDVLAQLAARKIQAESGTYFQAVEVQDFLNKYDDTEFEPNKREDLGKTKVCELIEGAKCTVCGVGAAFVSAVRLGDELTVKEVGIRIDDSDMRQYLNRYFDPPQVVLIECAFERDAGFAWDALGDQPSDADATAAERFGAMYSSDAKRMRAIFQNIIDNNGTFVPPPVEDGAVKSDDQEAQ